jgi:branched-chain amino acid transport system substrate-binding protein
MGRQALWGVQRWVEWANGRGGVLVEAGRPRRRVELVHYDDGSKRKGVREAVVKLIEKDRVDLLFGPYSSALTLEEIATAKGYGQVVWNHGGASDEAFGPMVVSVLTPASFYFHGVLHWARARFPEARRVAIIRSSKGSFSKSLAEGARAHAGRLGLEVEYEAAYEPLVGNLGQVVRGLWEAEADVVLSAGRLEDDVRLARLLVKDGVTARVIGMVGASTAMFREALGQEAGRFVAPSQWEYEASYAPSVGPMASELGLKGVEYAGAQACAMGIIAQRCVETSGALEERALWSAAVGLDCVTFYGRFRMDEVGRQVGHGMAVVRWEGGEKRVVWEGEEERWRALEGG